MHVLIVEDEKKMAELLKRGLEEEKRSPGRNGCDRCYPGEHKQRTTCRVHSECNSSLRLSWSEPATRLPRCSLHDETPQASRAPGSDRFIAEKICEP